MFLETKGAVGRRRYGNRTHHPLAILPSNTYWISHTPSSHYATLALILKSTVDLMNSPTRGPDLRHIGGESALTSCMYKLLKVARREVRRYVPDTYVIPSMLNIWNASTAPKKRNSQWECKKTQGEGKSNSSSCQQQRADPVWSCIYLYDRVSTTCNQPWGTAAAKLKPPPSERCFKKEPQVLKHFKVHCMHEYAYY